MTAERIADFTTGEWSEWVVERRGPRYYLRRQVRITGTQQPEWVIAKAQAHALDSAEACEALVAGREPTHTAVCR